MRHAKYIVPSGERPSVFRNAVFKIRIYVLLATTYFASAAAPARGADLTSDVMSSLSNPDSSAQKNAVQMLLSGLTADTRLADTVYRARVPDALIAAARFDDAADVCLRCAIAQPGRLDHLEYFLRFRTRALLGARRNEEALAAAKSLYNVASLGGTPFAIDLLAETLAAARPEDAGVARRFKLQQLAAASELSAASDAPADAILSTIRIDPSIYAGAPVERSREWRALSQGNIALMSDRPTDAATLFASMATSPRTGIQRAGMGGKFRAIKAVSGGLRAANAAVRALAVMPADL